MGKGGLAVLATIAVAFFVVTNSASARAIHAAP
jgi:hypothetical protein